MIFICWRVQHTISICFAWRNAERPVTHERSNDHSNSDTVAGVIDQCQPDDVDIGSVELSVFHFVSLVGVKTEDIHKPAVTRCRLNIAVTRPAGNAVSIVPCGRVMMTLSPLRLSPPVSVMTPFPRSCPKHNG